MQTQTIKKLKNSYLKTGNTVQVVSSDSTSHSELPIGTYVVNFNPMAGYSLELTNDLDVNTSKVYGNRQQKVDRLFKAWGHTDRSLGVMLSGDKGMGKSLFLRQLAQAGIENNLPVIRVTANTPGIADFIDTLGESIIVFDEFEKVFPAKRGDDGTNQSQFLPLFDGISTAKRIYCITVNDLNDISHYLISRSGRFHYHLEFGYPSPDEITEYLTDHIPDLSQTIINDVIRISSVTDINYDHLRAIVFELQLEDDINNVSVKNIVADLNISIPNRIEYKLEITFSSGVVLFDIDEFNPFDGEDEFYFSQSYTDEKGERRNYATDYTAQKLNRLPNGSFDFTQAVVEIHKKMGTYHESLGEVVNTKLTIDRSNRRNKVDFF